VSRGGPDHLATPDQTSVGARTAASGVTAIASNIAQMVIGVGTTLVLARLLDPAEFGVFAMGWVAVMLTLTIRDLGVGMAALNHDELTHDRASAFFWSSLLVNAACGIAIAALGPVLARAYDAPVLERLMPSLGAVGFIAGAATLHDAILKRRLRFAAVACRDIVAMLAGSAAAIAAAAAGAGVWALLAQQAALAAAGLGVTLAACPWKPAGPAALRRSIHDRAERALIWHGSRVSLARLVTALGVYADRVIIAAVAGDRAVGLYQAAFQWAEFPTRQVYQPLMGVVVSAFSRKQNADAARYRGAFRQALLLLDAVAIPMLVYGAVRGELVIPVLLGASWLDAAPIFEWLCVAATFRLVVQSCKWVYLAEGRSADQLRATLVLTPLLLGAALLGAADGPAGVARAVAIVYAVAAPLSAWYCTRRSRITPADILRPAIRPLLGAGIGAAAVLAAAPILIGTIPDWARLLAEAAVLAAASAIVWAFPGAIRDDLRACLARVAPRLVRRTARMVTDQTERARQ
jgi:PST family polysaccharide transporter